MALPYSVNLGIFNRLKNDISLRTRRRVFEIFMRECAPTQTSRVANFGAAGHRDHPVHYFFENLYPHRSNLTTVIVRASENAAWFPEHFPGLRFLEADLRAIPVPDLHFDCGLCNAVLEHAAPRDQQVALVREVCRVCRCVMFTTPNRWFPVEIHTLLPLLHWFLDAAYRRILRSLRLAYFADVENLNLLDIKTLASLFPATRSNRILRLGPPILATNLVYISSVTGS